MSRIQWRPRVEQMIRDRRRNDLLQAIPCAVSSLSDENCDHFAICACCPDGGFPDLFDRERTIAIVFPRGELVNNSIVSEDRPAESFEFHHGVQRQIIVQISAMQFYPYRVSTHKKYCSPQFIHPKCPKVTEHTFSVQASVIVKV